MYLQVVQASSEQMPRLRSGTHHSFHSPRMGQGLGLFPPPPNQDNSVPLPAWAGSGLSAGPHPALGLTTALSSSSCWHATGTCCRFLLEGGTWIELSNTLQASLGAYLDQEPRKQLCTSTGGTFSA